MFESVEDMFVYHETDSSELLTSALVRVVILSPSSRFSEVNEKCSPPARPMPRPSQNRICPVDELRIRPGSRLGPLGTRAWKGVTVGSATLSRGQRNI